MATLILGGIARVVGAAFDFITNKAVSCFKNKSNSNHTEVMRHKKAEFDASMQARRMEHEKQMKAAELMFQAEQQRISSEINAFNERERREHEITLQKNQQNFAMEQQSRNEAFQKQLHREQCAFNAEQAKENREFQRDLALQLEQIRGDAQKGLLERQYEISLALAADDHEFSLELLKKNTVAQRELNYENHLFRIDEQKNVFESQCKLAEYQKFIATWPLVNLPSVIRKEQISPDNHVKLRVFFSHTNNVNFNKYVYPNVEQGLREFADIYPNNLKSDNLIFYHNAFKNDVAGGAVNANILYGLQGLPVMIIDTNVLVDRITISLTMSSFASSDVFNKTVLNLPFDTFKEPQKELGYFINLSSEILSYLKFIVGYMYDIYNLVMYDNRPLLPLAAIVDKQTLDEQGGSGAILSVPDIKKTLREEYGSIYDTFLSETYGALSFKNSYLYDLRLNFASSVRDIASDDDYLKYLYGSLCSWVELRCSDSAEYFLERMLSDSEYLRKYVSPADIKYFDVLSDSFSQVEAAGEYSFVKSLLSKAKLHLSNSRHILELDSASKAQDITPEDAAAALESSFNLWLHQKTELTASQYIGDMLSEPSKILACLDETDISYILQYSDKLEHLSAGAIDSAIKEQVLKLRDNLTSDFYLTKYQYSLALQKSGNLKESSLHLMDSLMLWSKKRFDKSSQEFINLLLESKSFYKYLHLEDISYLDSVLSELSVLSPEYDKNGLKSLSSKLLQCFNENRHVYELQLAVYSRESVSLSDYFACIYSSFLDYCAKKDMDSVRLIKTCNLMSPSELKDFVSYSDLEYMVFLSSVLALCSNLSSEYMVMKDFVMSFSSRLKAVYLEIVDFDYLTEYESPEIKAEKRRKLEEEERRQQEAAAKEAERLRLEEEERRRYKVGKIVELGIYPQDSDGTLKPIEWKVLAIENGKALLFSEYGLDRVLYHSQSISIDWESCWLRKWLNGDFYNKAFSKDEKLRISLTKLPNADNSRYHIPGGKDTEDRIFCLSIDEAKRYFSSNSERCRKPTGFAVKNGAYVDSDNKNCQFWLRSPGYATSYAAYVNDNGYIDIAGFIRGDCLGVREGDVAACPALWINL